MKKRRFKKTKRLLQTACLAVGLTLAGWSGGPAMKTAAAVTEGPDGHDVKIEVYGTISPTSDLTDVWVFFSPHYLPERGRPEDDIWGIKINHVTGGTNYDFSFIAQYYSIPPWHGTFDPSYTVMGVYDSNGDNVGDSVCIGGTGISAGNSWETYFAVQEFDVVNMLMFDYPVVDFYSTYYETITQDIYYDINLWNFSNATPNGTAHADSRVVPIPGAVWLLGSGLAGLGLFRRRKTSRA
jgi:hypothetical protein